jgi:hypothetical protein
MSNAPERIWVDPYQAYTWSAVNIEDPREIEYIRRDAIIPAMAADLVTLLMTTNAWQEDNAEMLDEAEKQGRWFASMLFVLRAIAAQEEEQ